LGTQKFSSDADVDCDLFSFCFQDVNKKCIKPKEDIFADASDDDLSTLEDAIEFVQIMKPDLEPQTFEQAQAKFPDLYIRKFSEAFEHKHRVSRKWNPKAQNGSGAWIVTVKTDKEMENLKKSLVENERKKKREERRQRDAVSKTNYLKYSERRFKNVNTQDEDIPDERDIVLTQSRSLKKNKFKVEEPVIKEPRVRSKKVPSQEIVEKKQTREAYRNMHELRRREKKKAMQPSIAGVSLSREDISMRRQAKKERRQAKKDAIEEKIVVEIPDYFARSQCDDLSEFWYCDATSQMEEVKSEEFDEKVLSDFYTFEEIDHLLTSGKVKGQSRVRLLQYNPSYVLERGIDVCSGDCDETKYPLCPASHKYIDCDIISTEDDDVDTISLDSYGVDPFAWRESASEDVEFDPISEMEIEEKKKSSSFFRSMLADMMKRSTMSSLSEWEPYINTTLDFGAAMWLYVKSKSYDEVFCITWLFTNTFVSSRENRIGLKALSGFAASASSQLFFSLKKSKIVSQSFSEDAKGVSDFLTTVVSCDLVKSFRNLFVSLAMMKVFPKEAAVGIYKVLGKPEKANFLEVITGTVETIANLAKYSEMVWKGVPLSTLLGPDPVTTQVKKANYLLSLKDRTYSGLETPGYMHVVDYMKQCNETLLFLDRITAKMNPTNREHAATFRVLYDLQAVFLEKKAYLDSNDRLTPVCIVLHGDPGIGKSHLIRLILAIHSQVMGRKFSSEHIFSRCVNSEYWEGYNPYSQPYIHCSELGSKNKNIAKSMGDDILMELTSVIDNQRYPCNMAFGEKAKVFARPELVIIDTNNRNLNLDVVVENEAAFKRRFLEIQPSVKPQYRKQGGVQIDNSRTNDGTNFFDRWTFSVNANEALSIKKSKPVHFMNMANPNDDVYTLKRFLSKFFKDHVEKELSVKGRSEAAVAGVHEGVYDFRPSRLLKSPKDFMESKLQAGLVSQAGEEKCTAYTCYCDSGQCTFNAGVRPLFTPYRVEIKEKSGKTFHSVLPPVKSKRSFFSGVKGHAKATSSFTDLITSLTTALFWIACYNVIMGVLNLEVTSKLRWVTNSWLRCFMALCILISVYLRWLSFAWLPWSFMLCINYGIFMEHELKARVTKINQSVKQRLFGSWANFKCFAGFSKVLPVNGWKSGWETFALVVVGSLTVTALASICLTVGKKKKPIGSISQPKVASSVSETDIKANASNFKLQSDENRDLNALEDSFHCGKSYQRIPTKVPGQWNLRYSVTEPVHTSDVSGLLSYCSKNIRKFRIILGEKSVGSSYLFGLSNNYAIMNTHCFRGVKSNILLECSQTGEIKDGEMRPTVLNENDYVHLGNDLTLVSLSGINFRDVRKHVIDLDIPDEHTTGYIGGDVVPTSYTVSPKIIADDYIGFYEVSPTFSYKWPGAAKGKCGLPLIVSKGSGFVIAGVHCAAAGNDAYASVLTKKIIDQAYDKMQKLNPQTMLLSSQSFDLNFKLTSPSAKSAFRWNLLPNLDYYGKTMGNVTLNNKSRLIKSKFFLSGKQDLMFDKLDFIPTIHYSKPMMKPTTVDGVWMYPKVRALQKMGAQKKSVRRDVTKMCVSVILDQIERNTPDLCLQPLDMETAINGVYYDYYLKRINTSTSSGFGFDGPKSRYLVEVDVADNFMVRESVDSLKKLSRKQLEAYLAGETNKFVFATQLKDEPRELAKCRIGKTRVFFMSPVDFLILCRMFLGPFYTIMVEKCDIFHASLGIDMHRDADKLYHDLVDFSPLIMEGDYSNFDQSMPFEIGWAACDVIYGTLKRAGYNEKALTVVRGLLSDTMFPYVDVDGDIFCQPALQPSGKYATAEDNSLRNLLMLTYAWYANEKTKSMLFFDYVNPKIYGDDVLAAVKPAVKDLMNNITYAKVVKEDFGMDYTSAAKDGVLTEFVTPDKMAYLKRTFSYHKGLGRMVGKLDMNSIYKTLQWTIPSRSVSEQTQVLSTYVSSLREFYFHLDSQAYGVVRETLISDYCDTYSIERKSVEKYFLTFSEITSELQSPGMVVGDETQPPLCCDDEKDLLFPSIIRSQSGEAPCLHSASKSGLVSLKGINNKLRKGLDRPLGESMSQDHLESLILQKQEFIRRLIDLEEKSHDYPSPVDGMRHTDMKQMALYFTSHIFRKQVDRYASFQSQLDDLNLSIECITAMIAKKSSIIASSQCADEGSRDLENPDEEEISDESPEFCVGCWLFQMWTEARQGLHPELTSHSLWHTKYRDSFDDFLYDWYRAHYGMLSDEGQVIESQSADLKTDGDVIITMDVHENVKDVGGEITDHSDPLDSAFPSLIDSAVANIDKYFDRPVLIGTFAVPLSTDYRQIINPWQLYSSDQSVRAKFRNFAYISGDLNIRFAFEGTQFHYGRLQIGYMPMGNFNTVLGGYNTDYATSALDFNYKCWVSQMPGCRTVNVSENEPIEMTLPFIAPQPWLRTFNKATTAVASTTALEDWNNMGTLIIDTLSQLKAVSASATNISVNIYAWMSNVKLGCPTGTLLAVSQAKDERVVGPVEQVATRAASVARSMSSIPQIAPLATASAMVLDGVAGAASVYGFSEPTINTAPMRMKNQPYQNAANTIGYDTGKKITIDPKQELTVDGMVSRVKEDELSIASFTDKWGLFSKFTWNYSSTDSFPMLWYAFVTPMLQSVATGLVGGTESNMAQPTPSAFAAFPFDYWHGPLEFCFDFVASKFHKGKIDIVFEPNVNQMNLIAGNFVMNKQYQVTVDLQKTTTVIIRVDWASRTPWLANVITSSGGNGSLASLHGTTLPADPTPYNSCVNGCVYAVPLTSLMSPDSSSIDVLVYVRAPGTMFNAFGRIDNNVAAIFPGLPTEDEKIESQSMDMFPSVSEVIDINPDSSDISYLNQYYFGEVPTSFRQYLRRFELTGYLTGTFSTGNTVAFATLPVIPFLWPNVENTSITMNGGYCTLLNYLRYAFLIMKGGLRKRMRLLTSITSKNSDMCNWKVSLQPYTTYPSSVPTLGSGAAQPQTNVMGCVTFVPSTQAGVEFEIPFYCPSLFVISCNKTPWFSDPLFLTDYTGAFSGRVTYNVSIDVGYATSTDGCKLFEETAIGEDFTLSRFLACPPRSF